MRTLTFISIIVLCILFKTGTSQSIFSNQTDPNVIKYPIEQVIKAGTINVSEIVDDWFPLMKNTKVIHSPGVNIEKDKQREIKARANEEKRRVKELTNYYYETGSGGAKAAIPDIGYNFPGNSYGNSHPNDNNIAVGNDGKTVSVINSNIKISSISGQFLKVYSLSVFAASIGGNESKYDPVTTYDVLHDRFIIVFLNGDLSSTSKVIVAFSESNDPKGNWNIYVLNGNAIGYVWTDFPQIGISTQELFITGNMFSNSGQSQGSVIWQIELAGGYSGNSSLTVQKYTSNQYFSLHPVEGGINLQGPDFYLIRNNSHPNPASNTFYIHKITNTIANGGTLSAPVILTSNKTYKVPPNAEQKGSYIQLETNDCRIQTSYIEHDNIYFAFNTANVFQPSIYYGRIVLNTTNLNQSTVTAKYIYSSIYEYAYPSVAYGGATNPSGASSSLVFFNYTSLSHYPGNAAVFIDMNENISNLTVCKTGYNPTGQSTPWRWGDYTGASERHNNPGEVWVAGSYGGASNTTGTWISQLATVDVHNPIGINEMSKENFINVTAYPNPAIDIINFSFDVSSTRVYTASVYDITGKLIKTIVNKKLKEGTAKIQFNTIPLNSGTYFIVIESENSVTWKKKFIVNH